MLLIQAVWFGLYLKGVTASEKQGRSMVCVSVRVCVKKQAINSYLSCWFPGGG